MRCLTCQRSRSRFVAGENGCRRRSRCVHVRSTEKLRVARDPPADKHFLRKERENQGNIHCHCSRAHHGIIIAKDLFCSSSFSRCCFLLCEETRSCHFITVATVHLCRCTDSLGASASKQLASGELSQRSAIAARARDNPALWPYNTVCYGKRHYHSKT